RHARAHLAASSTAERRVLPISVVISRPRSSFSLSRISPALLIMRERSAKLSARNLGKVSKASWIFDSVCAAERGSKERSSSPVAGLTVAMGMTYTVYKTPVARRALIHVAARQNVIQPSYTNDILNSYDAVSRAAGRPRVSGTPASPD